MKLNLKLQFQQADVQMVRTTTKERFTLFVVETEMLFTDEGIQLDDKDQQEKISQASNVAQEETEKCTISSSDKDDTTKEDNSVEKDACDQCLYKMFKSFILLFRGWKTYMKYDVAFAGLGLACLYMTVIGFDSITVGKFSCMINLV